MLATFLRIMKVDPNHDMKGRFATVNHPWNAKGEFASSLGIERKDMPQIQSADFKEFVDFAKAKGAPISFEKVKASTLKPTQTSFNPEQTAQLPKEALAKPITVSSDNRVLDGTNRWAKNLELDRHGDVAINRIPLPVHDALKLMHSFPKVFSKTLATVGATRKSYAELLKKDQKRIPAGQHGGGEFAKGDGASNFTPEVVGKQLSDLGIDHKYSAEDWCKVMKGVTPKEFFDAYVINANKDTLKGLMGAITPAAGKIQFKLKETKIEGKDVEFYQRTMYPEKGIVKHDILEFEDSTKGGGLAKTLLKSSMELYKKMGIKKVEVFASLDLGAYTWAKFGFKMTDNIQAEGHAQEVFDRFSDILQKDHNAHKMTKEERKEVDAIGNLLDIDPDSPVDRTNNNQLLANLQTPHLDKRYAERIASSFPKKGTMMKFLMEGTSYEATLNLSNTQQMKTFNDYVNK